METEDLELNETNPIQTSRDWSTDSSPFHGFSGQPPEVKIDGAEEQEITDGIQVEQSSLKRHNSSLGSGLQRSKKRSKHPVKESSITIDTSTGSQVFQVNSKKEKSIADYTYCIISKGKMNILNLNRMTWHYIDAAEKFQLKICPYFSE